MCLVCISLEAFRVVDEDSVSFFLFSVFSTQSLGIHDYCLFFSKQEGCVRDMAGLHNKFNLKYYLLINYLLTYVYLGQGYAVNPGKL